MRAYAATDGREATHNTMVVQIDQRTNGIHFALAYRPGLRDAASAVMPLEPSRAHTAAGKAISAQRHGHSRMLRCRLQRTHVRRRGLDPN